MAEKEKVDVFYHHPCLDGAVAAWAAYKKWGDDADYIPINHDSDEETKKKILDNIDRDTHVVFADFCPKREMMDEIADHAARVTVYDHHDTAIEDMKGYHNSKVTLHFDKNRSGGAIIHDEFFGRRQRPQVVSLAEMIDLERTTEHRDFFSISAFVDSLPCDTFPQLLKSMELINRTPIQEIIERGHDIRQLHETTIRKTLQHRAWVHVPTLPNTDPVHVPIINANPHLLGREYSIKLRELAESSAPAYVALSWYEENGKVRVTVRTNGTPNAARVAEHIGSKELGHGLGGGGGATSAAARFTIEQFNRMFKRLTQEEVIERMTGHSIVIEHPSAELAAEPKPRERGQE